MTDTLRSMLAGDTAPGLFEWRGAPSADVAGEGRTAGWTVRELDTREVQDADQLYEQMMTAWALPEWFGRNLDALWDVLGDLAASPVLVVWDGCAELSAVDPQLAQNLLEMLRDASTQAQALAVVVRDAPALIGLDGLS